MIKKLNLINLRLLKLRSVKYAKNIVLYAKLLFI